MPAACKFKQNILTDKHDINKLLQLKCAQKHNDLYKWEMASFLCISHDVRAYEFCTVFYSLKLYLFLNNIYIYKQRVPSSRACVWTVTSITPANTDLRKNGLI